MYLCYVVIRKVVFPDKISVIHRLEIINLSSYVHFKKDVSDLYMGKAFQKTGKEFQNHVCLKDLGLATASLQLKCSFSAVVNQKYSTLA